MTDEQTTETPKQQEVSLFQVWGVHYELVLAHLVGNTVNKADKQQYRLKAADIALGLTALAAK